MTTDRFRIYGLTDVIGVEWAGTLKNVLAIAAGALLTTDAARFWRVILALPVGGASVGLFQVQAKTCVALAARGLRNMDSGDEAIANAQELARVRTQSRGVYVKAAVTTIVVTAILLVF